MISLGGLRVRLHGLKVRCKKRVPVMPIIQRAGPACDHLQRLQYGRSVSRELTAAFVTQWKASHPEGRMVDRDLNATSIPPISAEWVGAAYTPEQARTPQQKKLLSLSDSLLAELEQADEYVIGVPMHNFGVPSVLKLWIDLRITHILS